MVSKDPIARAMDDLDELKLFLEATVPSIEAARSETFEAHMRLRTALRKPIPAAEDYERIRARMVVVDEFVADKGEHYLFSLAVVKLCTILEAMTHGFLVDFLSDRQKWDSLPLLRKMEVPLIAFAKGDPEWQVGFLAEAVKDSVKFGLTNGVGKFEAVLNVLGFGGPVDSLVQRTLFEFVEVRNVIVHCSGTVDRRLSKLTEYADNVGQPLAVTKTDFRRFMLAVLWYVSEVLRRVAASEHEEQQEKDLQEICAMYLGTLTELSSVGVAPEAARGTDA